MMKFMIILVSALLVSCGAMPIDVHTNVLCPQPAAETLSPPKPLSQLPRLPGDEPSTVIGIFAQTAALDTAIYQSEVDKRQKLIEHGVKLCGWVR